MAKARATGNSTEEWPSLRNGYDDVTGLGSPSVRALAKRLRRMYAERRHIDFLILGLYPAGMGAAGGRFGRDSIAGCFGALGPGGFLAIVVLAAILFGLPGEAEAADDPSMVYRSQTISSQNGRDNPFSAGVSCPGGTVNIGGGWNNGGAGSIGLLPAASYSSGPGGWGIFGKNVAAGGNGDSRITVYASCAPTQAVQPRDMTYLGDRTVTLKPKPLSPHSAVIRSVCPANTLPISGGYAGDTNYNIGIAGSFPLGPNGLPTSGKPQWAVAGENTNIIPFNLNSRDLVGSGNCLNRSVAIMFELHKSINAVQVRDQKTVIAPCSTGQVLSGGVVAQNSDGDDFEYTGGFDAISFYKSKGFQAIYDSSSLYHHKLTVVAECATLKTAVADLTQEDFDTACRAALPDASGVRAVAGSRPTDWRCAGDDSPPVAIPGNAGVWACGATQDADRPAATYLRANDPMSWVCYENARDRQLPIAAYGGTARGLNAKAGRAEILVKGRVRIGGRKGILKRSRAVLAGTLIEGSRAGDLFARRRGGDRPAILKVARRRPASGGRGQLAVYKGGKKGRFKLKLRKSRSGDAVRFALRVNRASIDKPRLCDNGPKATTHLATRVLVGGGDRPAELFADGYWRCRNNRLVTADPALPLP